MLAPRIAPQFAIAACDPHGQVIGVIGFRTPHGSFVGGGFPDLRPSYGRIGGPWRAGCLRVLAPDLEARPAMVDGHTIRPELPPPGRGPG